MNMDKPISIKLTGEDWRVVNEAYLCATSWEPDARLIGNLQAGELARFMAKVINAAHNDTPGYDPLVPKPTTRDYYTNELLVTAEREKLLKESVNADSAALLASYNKDWDTAAKLREEALTLRQRADALKG